MSFYRNIPIFKKMPNQNKNNKGFYYDVIKQENEPDFYIDDNQNVTFFKAVPKDHLQAIKTTGLLIDAPKFGATNNLLELATYDSKKQYISPQYLGASFFIDLFAEHNTVSVMLAIRAPVGIASKWRMVYTEGNEAYFRENVPPEYIYVVLEEPCDNCISMNIDEQNDFQGTIHKTIYLTSIANVQNGGKKRRSIDYTKMTVKELQELARKRKVPYSNLRKAQLILALRSKKPK